MGTFKKAALFRIAGGLDRKVGIFSRSFFFRALKGNDAPYKILCPRSVTDNCKTVCRIRRLGLGAFPRS
jgi:hypothetical protein